MFVVTCDLIVFSLRNKIKKLLWAEMHAWLPATCAETLRSTEKKISQKQKLWKQIASKRLNRMLLSTVDTGYEWGLRWIDLNSGHILKLKVLLPYQDFVGSGWRCTAESETTNSQYTCSFQIMPFCQTAWFTFHLSSNIRYSVALFLSIFLYTHTPTTLSAHFTDFVHQIVVLLLRRSI